MRAPLFFLSEDARILDLIRRGDEEALVRLYRSNRKAIEAFVAKNNGSHDDAEDLLQEALVILWERVRAGRFEYNAKLNTFLYATVKNIWLRRLARQRREIPSTGDLPQMANQDPSILEELIESEQAKLIQDALNKLGEPCRKLLLLFYWEELSMEEIAQEMGFANAKTVKSKKYQCKKALEKLLKEYEHTNG